MLFRLVPKSSTLDDLELLYVHINLGSLRTLVGMFGRQQWLNE